MRNPLDTLSWDFRGTGVVFLYHGSSGAFVSSGLWHIHSAVDLGPWVLDQLAPVRERLAALARCCHSLCCVVWCCSVVGVLLGHGRLRLSASGGTLVPPFFGA